MQHLWETYINQHTTPDDPVLQALVRETHLTTLMPQMLSSPAQGRLLTLLVQLAQPHRVLEIGTFTGYSAICLARGLPPAGHVHTLEANDELARFHRHYFALAGMQERITAHYGPALAVLPTLQGPFQVAFIDADKLHYMAYYEAVLPLLPSGGLLIADNVLWHGQVADAANNSPETVALRAFNTYVCQDGRVEHVLLPLRDGLMLIRKK